MSFPQDVRAGVSGRVARHGASAVRPRTTSRALAAVAGCPMLGFCAPPTSSFSSVATGRQQESFAAWSLQSSPSSLAARPRMCSTNCNRITAWTIASGGGHDPDVARLERFMAAGSSLSRAWTREKVAWATRLNHRLVRRDASIEAAIVESGRSREQIKKELENLRRSNLSDSEQEAVTAAEAEEAREESRDQVTEESREAAGRSVSSARSLKSDR